jgi:hypothetical protein
VLNGQHRDLPQVVRSSDLVVVAQGSRIVRRSLVRILREIGLDHFCAKLKERLPLPVEAVRLDWKRMKGTQE